MAISPDDTDKPFAARWNALVSALLVEPSIKLVARTACDYGVMTGEKVYPGNERLARQTGLTERSVREAWHFLRAADMAVRVAPSTWTGSRRTADHYELAIPSGWRCFPLLGPHAGRFTCQQCGKLFNPQPCNVFEQHRKPGAATSTPSVDRDGVRDLRWALWKAVFCPAPRSGNGCRHYWERANGPWNAKHSLCWEMFHKARDDEWPPAIAAAALPEVTSATGSEFRQHPEVSSGIPGSEFRQVPEVSSGQLST